MLLFLLFVAAVGVGNVLGIPGLSGDDNGKKKSNLEWDTIWEGSKLELNAFVTGLYFVIW